MAGRRYIGRFVASLCTCAAVVLVFNLIVDPFGLEIVHSPLTFNKPDLASYNRPYKASRLLAVKPRTIIVGTSRTEFGIDPRHPAFGGDNSSAYNLALNGITLAEMRDVLDCANKTGTRRVVIGLDFYNFNIYHELAPNAQPFQCPQNALLGIKYYLSLDALKASAKAIASTVALASKRERFQEQPISENGLENSQLRFGNLVATMGYHNLFLLSERDYLMQGYRFYPAWAFRFSNPQGDSTMERFREVIRVARRNHMQVYLFLSPSHARDWEIIRVLGLWPEFEEWKRQIVHILEEDKASHPGEPPIVLWDFSGYNSFTTEDLPPVGDRTSAMRWYWESAHYKKELGDVVLDKMFGYTNATRPSASDFGFLLNSGNVEQHLAAVREEQARYHRSHATDVREIEELGRSVAAVPRAQPQTVPVAH